MKKALLWVLCTYTFAAFSQGFEHKKKPVSSTPNLGERPVENMVGPAPLVSLHPLKNNFTKDQDGTVVRIEKNFDATKSKQERKSLLSQSFEFFTENKSLLGLKNAPQEIELVSETTDDAGQTHVKFRQVHQGVEVYGTEAVLHEKNGQIFLFTGRLKPTPQLENTSPKLSKTEAYALAIKHLSKTNVIQNNAFVQKMRNEDSGELVVYSANNQDVLAYNLSVRPNMMERFSMMVDATSGAVLKINNTTCAVNGPVKASAKDLNGVMQSFQAYEYSGRNYLIDASKAMFKKTTSVFPDDPVGVIWTIDALNTALGDNTRYEQITSANLTSWEDVAVSAHTNASICYDYYSTKFNRVSLNGKGGNIMSVVNLKDEDGKGMDNAFWNGYYMGYGNGATAFTKLAKALDVAGHEMTHGVVENSAKLEYSLQSGALNESMADIFGVLIENRDLAAGSTPNWTLGEQVVIKSAFPTGALRSLSNPNQGYTSMRNAGYQPKTMSQYVVLNDTPDEDNGGVHINSGIPNYAFYLFASKPEVGLDVAGKVYYQTMTKYLTRFSQFLDLRIAVIQSCKDLYANNTAIEAAAKAAFDAVGIKDGSTTSGGGGTTTTPTQKTPDLPENAGTEFLVVLEPSTNDIYVTPGNNLSAAKIYKSYGMRSKPSVTDDGSAIFFVANDKNIYRIANPTTASAAISKVSTDGSWDNVAVSKDGKRLAALKAVEDKYMYVFNLANNGEGKQFTLYNPTYSQGVTTGDVIYADSFEWDFKGENIVYDAFNTMKKPSGESIDYWDVGLIKVWDTSKNTWNTGTVQKIFSNLEEGENIGNPSFSKRSQDVLLFDYFNANTNANEFQILGVDLYNNQVKTLAKSTVVGYPNYSKDDKYVTFNTRSNSSSDLSKILVGSSKIDPSGSAATLYQDASLGVWFAAGTRALPTKQAQTITFKQIANQVVNTTTILDVSASSKLPVTIKVISGDASVTDNVLTCGSTLGEVTLRAYQQGSNDFAAAKTVDMVFRIIEAPKQPTVLATEPGVTVVVFPNPAAEYILIEGTDTPHKLEIYGSSGTLVKTVEKTNKIGVKDLPKGLYLVQSYGKSGISTHRVLLQ